MHIDYSYCFRNLLLQSSIGHDKSRANELAEQIKEVKIELAKQHEDMKTDLARKTDEIRTHYSQANDDLRNEFAVEIKSLKADLARTNQLMEEILKKMS